MIKFCLNQTCFDGKPFLHALDFANVYIWLDYLLHIRNAVKTIIIIPIEVMIIIIIMIIINIIIIIIIIMDIFVLQYSS